MKTAEEKATEYADGMYPNTDNNDYSRTPANEWDACYDGYVAGYNEAMSRQSSPKIKQLEWDFYGTYYSAETPVGHYMILQGDEQYWENCITCTLTHNGGFVADFDNLEEAKTYAQKHFEARVKECLIIEQV